MAQVVLKKLCKTYEGGVVAVRDVDLTVHDREFVVMVGPSGCGKSTTLRMIAGLEEITSGELRIGDRLMNDVAPKDRDIAMVFQNYALYPHMSVFDNMAFGLKLRKLPKAEIVRRVTLAAQMLGLEPYLQRKPKALSGGQRQRVAMGRAVVREPAVFLFDEPLSNLDAKMRVAMRAELVQLRRRVDTTMVYVTHDQIEAMTLGDRIVVMKDGIVQQMAEPLDVYMNPANDFVAQFIGTPPMNLFDGELVEASGALRFQNATMDWTLPERLGARLRAVGERSVRLGVRPESLVAEADTGAAFSAETSMTEMLGSELIVHAMVGETPFAVRMKSSEQAKTGQVVRWGVDLSTAHVFSRESGENLTLRI